MRHTHSVLDTPAQEIGCRRGWIVGASYVCALCCAVPVMLSTGCGGAARNAQRLAARQHNTPVERVVPLGSGISLQLVLVPAGSFAMGSDDRKLGPDCQPNWPSNRITLTKPFYIGKYEVTQAQWRQVMGKSPTARQAGRSGLGRRVDGDTSRCPVGSVTWEECLEFARRLTALTQNRMVFRLPTEAEWEYACRAGSRAFYCFGNSERKLRKYAWFRENSDAALHPVGHLKPNAWGIHDMHGNSAEYCSDWLGYYRPSPRTDPIGDKDSAEYRAVRGGCFLSYPISCRSSSRKRSMCILAGSALAKKRGYAAESGRSPVIGLRIAATLPDGVGLQRTRDGEDDQKPEK